MADTEAATDDLDFLGNGSLAEIMSKMGDIDKVLSEISEIDTRKTTFTNSSTAISCKTASATDGTTSSSAAVIVSYDESSASLFSDGDVNGYGCEDVTDLQGELMAADETERQAKDERMKLAEMKKQCIKNRTTTHGTWEDPSGGDDEEKAVMKSITVALTKPSKEWQLGLSMKTSNGITRIVSISDDGLLVGSGLEPKQQLVEVNGVVLKNARHARHVIQSSPDEVTIVALHIGEEI